MPNKGWTSVTLHDKYYKTAKALAKKDHRTVASFIEVLILQADKITDTLTDNKK